MFPHVSLCILVTTHCRYCHSTFWGGRSNDTLKLAFNLLFMPLQRRTEMKLLDYFSRDVGGKRHIPNYFSSFCTATV